MNVKIVDKLIKSNKYENNLYLSSFDGEIISNLFSNLKFIKYLSIEFIII